MGHVIQAGAGQITARQAAVKGGIPMTVPALTVNKVCLSGLNAIAMADQLIGFGEFDVVVAGGMESMTNGPYLLPGARGRLPLRRRQDRRRDRARRAVLRVRPARHGRLHRLLQQAAERSPARSRTSTRRMSHERAADGAARTACSTTRSSTVTVPQRKGDPITVTEDEGVRPGTTAASLAKLRPGVRRGRHGHRRLGLADLRRRRRGGGDVAGPRPRSWARRSWPRSGRTAPSPGPTRRCCPSRPTRSSRRWAGRA